MKRLFSLAVALAACVCAHAVWFSSAPGSVDSGQSYWVSADESTYSYDTEIYLYKNGSFFAYGNGWGYASAGNSTTDYGAQTVTYEAYSSWYDDWWNSYGDYTSTSVSITQPNNAPSISWHVSPSWVPVGENYYVQVRGYDPDGNLYGVSVWKNGVPYALNGGQNTTEMYSDVNWLAEGSPQQITFSAQAYDNSGAQSEIIYHTVNIYVPNVAPTVTWVNYPPQSAYINQSFAVQARGNDNNANLSWIYVWRDDQPFAFNGASGAEGYSDNNLATGTAPYPTTFKAMAGDTSGADSGFIYGTTSIINRNPTMTPTTITGPTVAWNSTYQHYTMWSGDPGISGSGNLTMASTIQDADANLVNHTLRYRQVTLNPNTWIQLGNNVPVTASTSTKQATLTTVETPGQWDFNAFGHDGWYSHPGESKTMWVYGSTNTAAFVSQAINGNALTGGTPTFSLNTGNNTATATILMRNTGSKPWQNPDSQFNTPHRLGAIGATPGVWGSSVRDMASAMVDPESFPGTNDTATFTFTFNIPQTPGNYVFQWKMMEQGVAGDPFFETATPAVSVTVIDTTPPNPATNLFASNRQATSFKLNWTAATDNGIVTGYDVYKDGVKINPSLVTTNSFTVEGLVLGTTYVFKVRAIDGVGLSTDSGNFPMPFIFDPVADYDGDSISNGWEEQYGFDPYTNDGALDPDGDGVTNAAEYAAGTNPRVNESTALPAGWPNAPSGNTNLVGFTPGSFAVDQSGGANYSIPLWVSPGTNGMQPAIALSYNSNNGNGYLGAGWNLSGLPVISRRNALKAADGYISSVNLDASDRFALDGNRLLVVSGTHGADGAEYRTERESFSQVYSYGSTGYGPEKFLVKTKAGLTMEFGYSTDADGGRIMAASPAPGGAVMAWSLDKITDAAGNYCRFHYAKNTVTGEFYIQKISYTGNTAAGMTPYAEVEFVYEARGDIHSGFAGGAPWMRSVRLQKVISKYNGSAVRSYALSYEASPNTGRSRLVNVQEFDATNSSLPSIAFQYKAESNGWSGNVAAYETPESLTRVRSAGWLNGQTGAGFTDIDGDGLPDFLHKHDDNNTPASVLDTNMVALNTGSGWDTGFANSSSWLSPRILGDYHNNHNLGVRFVDLDSDGYQDIITSRNFNWGSEAQKDVWLNRPSGWTSSGSWFPSAFLAGGTSEKDLGVRYVDLDGDGRTDVLWAQYDSTNHGALRNNGSGWENFPGGTNFTPPSGIRFGDDNQLQGPARLLDLNGDGLMDIVRYERGFGSSVAYLNTGTGWAPAPAYAPQDWVTNVSNGFMPTDFVDINGDGLVDQVSARKGNATIAAYFKTWLNTGKGWQEAPAYALPKQIGEIAGSSNPGWYRRYGAAFGDFNGDGFVDFMYATQDNGSLGAGGYWTYLNTGSGWVESSAYSSPVNLAVIQADTNQGYDTGAQFLDANGDGVVDLLTHFHSVDFTGGDPRFKTTRLNLSGRPDLLEKITASSGLQTNLEYKYLTDKTSGVYTRGSRPANSTFPVIDVQNPSYVVRAVTQDDGNGGTYQQTYSYGELRQSFTEGNLGFGWMKITDSRTNVTTESIYRQDYPFVGLSSSVVSRKSNGDKLSEVTTQWDRHLNSGNSRVAYPYAQVTVEKSYEPNTSGTIPFLTKTTTTACNASWGDPTQITTDFSDGYQTVEARNPTYSGTPQYPGQMSEQTIAVTAYALAPNPLESKTRTSKFTYDSVGRLANETVEPNDGGSPRQYYKSTTYTRDGYGNVQHVEVYADGNNSHILRITDFEYAASLKGRFLTKRTARVGADHITTFDQYDEGLGALKQKTEKAYNGVGADIVTTYTIDSLGRVSNEIRPDGTTAISRFWSASGPAGTLYAIQTLTDGGVPVLEFFDTLGRSRRTLTVTGDRQITKADTTYDNRGLVNYQSRPYTGSTAFATTTAYDVLARPYSVSTPTGTYIHAYDGFKTTTSLPTSQYTSASSVTQYTRNGSKETTRNGQGWTTKVIDSGVANGVTVTSQITYTYDPFGALKSTTDSANNVTTITPDLYGRKIQVVDPDRGTWSYQYYGTGELRQQTDGRSKVTSMEYDGIGRLSKRTVDATGTPQVTIWTYDTASGFGRGNLHTVSAPEGYSEARTYDSLGHTTQVSRTIDGSSYAFNYTYDSFGRLKTTVFPSTLTVRRFYGGFGHLTEMRNNSTQTLYFRGDEYSADGQLQHAVYGNGLETDRFYRPEDGLIEMIQTGRPTAPTELQYLGYSYEPGTVGNLYKRTDFRQNLAERFTYDGLVRLTEVWRGPADNSAGTQTLAMTYNLIGNLMNRAGQGYNYWSTRPHAVQTALGNTYSYDNNGNLTGVTGAKTATLSWKAFNQPDTITQGAVTSSFKYDADLQRVLQTKEGGKKIVYVGRELEREINGGTTTDSQFLFTPLGRTVEIVHVNGTETARRYYFTDNLGSVDTVVTDMAITSPERLSYDAWGVRRLANWTAGSVSTTTRRGFTDHEMLDGLGLVHMNGRIYDSALGRFVSADPINQDIFNTQTYNAYSYVLNNPLSYTDPTGMTAQGPALALPTYIVIGRPGIPLPPFPGFGALPMLGIIRSQVNSSYINQSFQPLWRALPSDQALTQGRMILSFYSYGVIKGFFHDIPVGAWDLAGMLYDLSTPQGQVEAGMFVRAYRTDPDFKAHVNQALKNGVKESFATPEQGMMTVGRGVGGIVGTKGLGEAVAAIKAATRLRTVSGMAETASVAGSAANPYAGIRQASQYLAELGVPRAQRVQILQSFEAGTVNLRAAGQSEFGLRFFDGVNAQARGRYLFETFPATRESLALAPKWNQMTNFTQWQIREGAILIEGRTAAQGAGLPGGQIQKFVPNLDDLFK